MMNLSKIDIQLLTSAVSERRSGKELSKAVGGLLTPEQAVLRLKNLLVETDILSEVEERKLLLLDARRIMGVLNEHIDNGDLQAVEIYRKFLTTVAERLDKSMVSLDAMSTKLTAAYAQVMAAAVMAAFAQLPKALELHGVEVDMVELEGVFQEVLPAAVAEIEARTENE